MVFQLARASCISVFTSYDVIEYWGRSRDGYAAPRFVMIYVGKAAIAITLLAIQPTARRRAQVAQGRMRN